MRSLRLIIYIAMFVSLALGLEGCRSSRSVSRGSQGKVTSSVKGKGSGRHDNLIILQKFPADVQSGFGDAMVAEARRWIGVPYRFGGADMQGADCSGLVMEVVREVAQTAIPRNSRAQQRYCSEVTIPQIRVGDLVFFSADHSPEGITHVGIYCGDGRMIHASSSRGVIESQVDKGYWAERFCCVGRPIGAIQRWEALHGKDYIKSTSPKVEMAAPAQAPVPAGNETDPVQTIELLDLLLDQKLDSIVGSGFMD